MKKTIGIIKQIDLVKNSANKLNKSMEVVRQGVGIHKSKKGYRRSNNRKEILLYFNIV